MQFGFLHNNFNRNLTADNLMPTGKKLVRRSKPSESPDVSKEDKAERSHEDDNKWVSPTTLDISLHSYIGIIVCM